MEAITVFLAIVLGLSAARKVAAPERLGTSAAQLTNAPLVHGQMLSFSAAAFEGLAALALLFQDTRVLGAFLATTMWAVYSILLWRRRGQLLDCGCSFGSREKPLPLSASAKAAGLAVLGIVAFISPADPIKAEDLFAGLGFVALYLALDELMAIPQPAWRHG